MKINEGIKRRVSNETLEELSTVFEKAVLEAFEAGQKSVEEVIEHNGLRLVKVNRDVLPGVYVRFYNTKNESKIKDGVIYGPVKRTMTIGYKDYNVFNCHHNRTRDNIEVFEVVKEHDEYETCDSCKKELDKMKNEDIYIEELDTVYCESCFEEAMKTKNQKRAELIQRAKFFVEENWDVHLLGVPVFRYKDSKRRVTCLIKNVNTKRIYSVGRADCHPDDVFNADIGKAIALARALEIDIPEEFLNAVQPDEVVKGQNVTVFENLDTEQIHITGELVRVEGQDLVNFSKEDYLKYFGREFERTTLIEGEYLITDDTNAEYKI